MPISKPKNPQESFIHEYTRSLLVDWADQCVRTGKINEKAYCPGAKDNLGESNQIYLDHAVSKGWISKDMTRVLAVGFTAAAGMLKR